MCTPLPGPLRHQEIGGEDPKGPLAVLVYVIVQCRIDCKCSSKSCPLYNCHYHRELSLSRHVQHDFSSRYKCSDTQHLRDKSTKRKVSEQLLRHQQHSLVLLSQTKSGETLFFVGIRRRTYCTPS